VKVTAHERSGVMSTADSTDTQRATTREAAPRAKNWQQRWAAGSAGVSQPLDLDGTVFPAGNCSRL
jgi:hypothetical protein